MHTLISQINYLSKGIEALGIKTDEDKLAKMLDYMKYVLKANEQMNLTSVKEEEAFIELHIVDSLTLLLCTELNGRVIDIGTGAGFPGMILKLTAPQTDITFLDSLTKRLKFLETAISDFAVSDASILDMRAEEGAKLPAYRDSFDICVSRAVAALPALCEYCLPYVKTGGKFIAMKGKNVADELEEARKIYPLLGAEIAEIKKVTLPYSSSERNLIVFQKIAPTPQKYPRPNSVIKKSLNKNQKTS